MTAQIYNPSSDTIAPEATAVTSPGPNANGWNNTAVKSNEGDPANDVHGFVPGTASCPPVSHTALPAAEAA